LHKNNVIFGDETAFTVPQVQFMIVLIYDFNRTVVMWHESHDRMVWVENFITLFPTL